MLTYRICLSYWYCMYFYYHSGLFWKIVLEIYWGNKIQKKVNMHEDYYLKKKPWLQCIGACIETSTVHEQAQGDESKHSPCFLMKKISISETEYNIRFYKMQSWLYNGFKVINYGYVVSLRRRESRAKIYVFRFYGKLNVWMLGLKLVQALTILQRINDKSNGSPLFILFSYF